MNNNKNSSPKNKSNELILEPLDWRTPEDYNYVEELDAVGIAWEFLRRNSHYHDDFKLYNSGNLVDEFGNKPKKLTLSGHIDGKFFFTPQLKPNQSPRKWYKQHIINRADGEFLTPEQYLSRKWGILGLPISPDIPAHEIDTQLRFYPQNPKILNAEDIRHYSLSVETYCNNNFLVRADEFIPVDKCIIEFSLLHSFDTQIKIAQQKLKHIRKNRADILSRKRKRTRRLIPWINALRTWDARHHPKPSSFRIIGEVILNDGAETGTNRASKLYHKTAKPLIEEKGYLSIL